MVSERDAAYFTAAAKADGPLPDTLDSGHPYTLDEVGGSPGFEVGGDALVNPTGLAYLNLELRADVRQAWIETMWTSVGGDGTSDPAVIIISASRFAFSTPEHPAAALHLLIYRNRFIVEKRTASDVEGVGGVSTNLGSYTYATPLTYDEWHRLGVLWDGSQLTIVRGDGGTKTYPLYADMKAWWGNWACIETVASVARDDVTIRAFRVSSDVSIPVTSSAAAGGDSLGSAAKAQGTYVKLPGTTTLALTTAYQTVLTHSVTIPPSLALAVTVSLPVSVLADGNLSVLVDLDGNPTSSSGNTVLEAQALDGVVTWSTLVDASAFDAGASSSLRVRAAHTGTGTYRTSSSGPVRRATVIVQEALGVFV